MPANITTIKAGNIYKQLGMNQTHKIVLFVEVTSEYRVCMLFGTVCVYLLSGKLERAKQGQ